MHESISKIRQLVYDMPLDKISLLVEDGFCDRIIKHVDKKTFHDITLLLLYMAQADEKVLVKFMESGLIKSICSLIPSNPEDCIVKDVAKLLNLCADVEDNYKHLLNDITFSTFSNAMFAKNNQLTNKIIFSLISIYNNCHEEKEYSLFLRLVRDHVQDRINSLCTVVNNEMRNHANYFDEVIRSRPPKKSLAARKSIGNALPITKPKQAVSPKLMPENYQIPVYIPMEPCNCDKRLSMTKMRDNIEPDASWIFCRECYETFVKAINHNYDPTRHHAHTCFVKCFEVLMDGQNHEKKLLGLIKMLKLVSIKGACRSFKEKLNYLKLACDSLKKIPETNFEKRRMVDQTIIEFIKSFPVKDHEALSKQPHLSDYINIALKDRKENFADLASELSKQFAKFSLGSQILNLLSK